MRDGSAHHGREAAEVVWCTARAALPALDSRKLALLRYLMGFRAPSADEVYRYALRLDERERTLTDRFGWTILMVGDYSEPCREFLIRYCVDLCARTADRVRFVFFSEMPAREFERITANANRTGRMPANGMLGSVLAWFANAGRRRVYFEQEHWRDLRPAALEPFSSVSEIEAHLSWACTQCTAMPGAEEGLRFAQRLGIGRYVPCIVVFTDIGDLDVHALPFQGHSPGEVYRRVRGWIDSYYEINRGTLEYWSAVEDQIREISTAAAASLRKVQGWSAQRQMEWRNLRRLAELIQALSVDEDRALTRLAELTREYELPLELRDALRQFADRLATFDEQLSAGTTMAARAAELAGLTTTEEIGKHLEELAGQPPRYAHSSTRTVLRQASSTLSRRRPQLSPRAGLLAWWEHNAPFCSKREFTSWRQAWRWVADIRKGSDESVADHKRRDYAAFWSALGSRALNEEAAAIGEAVMLAMTDHYGVPAASPRWRSTTHEFHQWLVSVVEQLQITAPDWLLRRSPAVLIRECVPAGLNDRASFGRYLASSAELNALLQEKPAAATEAEDLRRAAHFRHRDVVSQALRADARRLSTVRSDRQAAVVALSAYLETARAELQATVVQYTSTGEDGAPARLDLATVERLTAALGNYHRAVTSIVYPHLSDHVIRIPIEWDIRRAVNLPESQLVDPVERLRSAIERAVVDDHAATASWPQVRQDTSNRSPIARLERGLAAALTGPRLREVLATVPGESSTEKIRHVVQHGRLATVLEAMTSSELDQLLSSVSEASAPPTLRLTIRDAVLVDLGMTAQDSAGEPRADAAEELRRKMQKNEFDVFMAHHSTDRSAVLELCSLLRREGIYPWLDIEQIPPGSLFQDAIQSAIRTVRAAAIVLGPDGIGRWQQGELRAFIGRCFEEDIPVIPVLLPGVSQIPEEFVFLRGLHHVIFEKTLVEASALRQLIWGITRVSPAEHPVS